DSAFLTMLSYPLVEGDTRTALKNPKSIVISETLGRKFFGNESPLGKELSLNRELNLMITGVMKDIPQNSHLSINALVSFSSVGDKWGYDQWRWPEFYNYVLLKPGASASNLESKLPAFVNKYLGDVIKEYKWKISMQLQSVPAIHLTSNLSLEQDVNGSERVVYFLGLLGVFILIVAWINYINLSTAKSLERSKEVGLRKVVGASKRQLVTQFFFDAFLVNFLALLLSFCLLTLAIPAFEDLVGKNITGVLYQNGLFASRQLWIFATISILAGTLMVGAYPALLLSSFNPAQVLKGKFYKSSGGVLLRKCLVSFQFAMSIFLIAGTITMYRQMSYMQKEDLGYSKDQVLVLKTPAVFDSTIQEHIEGFKNKLAQLPAVKNSTTTNGIPGKVLLSRNGVRKISEEPDANINCFQLSVDEDFLSTFGIPVVSGRALTKNDAFVYNKETVIMINETMSRQLGFSKPEDALHEKVTFGMGPDPQHGEIVGVLKDYHQVSLKQQFTPMMFILPSFYFGNYISIDLDTKLVGPTVNTISDLYAAAFPNNAFEYFFLDDYFNNQYQGDIRLGRIFGVFTGLAIIIACLGLLGLSIFAVLHRTREVGVRKVLGASITSILILFSRDFVKLLLIAYLIALPIVYFAVDKWLSTFAFHISPGWEIFLTPLLLLLLISMSTVCFICLKAASANPTAALRQD
ncbi:MAG TPA: ABC transporter permease, partial [Chryseolinea sp.]|nr:ABC transporter permease [Chryseolinea sp.]